MSTPESKVKKYLVKRVKALGGVTRFTKYIGRNHCPDCLVILPIGTRYYDAHYDILHLACGPILVETKADDDPRSGQAREHERLRDLGAVVLVPRSIEDVDRAFPP